MWGVQESLLGATPCQAVVLLFGDWAPVFVFVWVLQLAAAPLLACYHMWWGACCRRPALLLHDPVHCCALTHPGRWL